MRIPNTLENVQMYSNKFYLSIGTCYLRNFGNKINLIFNDQFLNVH